MKAYKFRDAVKNVAAERGIKIYSSHEDFIREIVKEMESNLITAKEAVEKLQDNKDFRMHFKDEDFDDIEREIR